MLLCIGREPQLDQLQLDKAGVRTDDVSHKIIVQEDERTTVQNIYALGDVAMVMTPCHNWDRFTSTCSSPLHQDRPELTPVAIKAGRLLARRLYGESASLVDYSKVCRATAC